jgi:hypothetical protein
MRVSPIEIQKHLSGISYPASRDEVIATAETNGAPAEILAELRALTRDEFDGPDDVMEELGGAS